MEEINNNREQQELTEEEKLKQASSKADSILSELEETKILDGRGIANFICKKANLFASLLALHGWYPKAVLSVLHQPTALCAVQIQGTCSNGNILAQAINKINRLCKFFYFSCKF